MQRYVTWLLLFAGVTVLQTEALGQDVETLLAELKAECEHPTSPDAPKPESYLSVTEHVRWRILAEFRKQKWQSLELIRTEMKEAEGDYRQMLAISLAALGDEHSFAETTNILITAKSPALRVCAARVLRDVGDKRAIPVLSHAMHDSYKRLNGSDVRTGPDDDGMCFPVRIVAAGALATLGISREEITHLDTEHGSAQQPH